MQDHRPSRVRHMVPNNRIEREKKTVEHMIRLYCKGNHGSSVREAGSGETGVCTQCEVLLTYATDRLDNCPHGNGKPTCLKCSIRCFDEEKREMIRRVMRYSGLRMLFRYPVLTIRHMLEGRGGK